MKKFTIKVPAKINLTLDVVGVDGKYHNIESLVTSVNVYDTVTVSRRRDGRITVDMRGIPVDCEICDNNAYKAAKLF
jgi:4-diphosphocytidyl-2-C-methyl-D-erythritol kinase